MTLNEITFCYKSNAIVIQRSIFILNILLASSLKAAKFRYSRESSDFFSEIEKMDTIMKRENCLEDSKLAKQAMMCSCVCWPHNTKRTKSTDLRQRRRKSKPKKCLFYELATCACALGGYSLKWPIRVGSA